MARYKAIVIGVSYGGTKALSAFIPALSKNFPIPIIIVQHQHNAQEELLHIVLNNLSKINVIEAKQNEKILAKNVYIAPGGYHLFIENEKTFSLSVDNAVNYSIPSIDVLFESASDVYRDKLIGIILTGANGDGSEGLKTIRQNGGLSIVEDPKTAQVNTMPSSALKIAGANHILSLDKIISFIKGEHYE